MSEATLRAELGFVDSIWPKIKEAIDGSIFAVDTSSPGVEGALKVAADIALTKWREGQAVSLPDRETLAEALSHVFEMGTLPNFLNEADAVLAALSTQPAAGGAQLIAAERGRQITEEGYTAEQDNGHASDLAQAAKCYVEEARFQIGDGPGAIRDDWPWEDRFWKPTGDPVRDLTKAGALIAAAIDSALAERAEVQP